MGGVISLTLRKPCGETIYMRHGTNYLPSLLTDPGIYSGKINPWIDELVGFWREMEQEHASQPEVRKHQHHLTRYCAPWNLLAPYDYGLIVVDLKTKTLMSSQNFCSEPCEIHNICTFNSPKRRANLKALVENDMVRRYRLHSTPPDDSPLAVDPEIKAALLAQRYYTDAVFLVEPPGFTLQEYPQTLGGYLDFFTDLQALDFPLDRPNEHTLAWINYVGQSTWDEDSGESQEEARERANSLFEKLFLEKQMDTLLQDGDESEYFPGKL